MNPIKYTDPKGNTHTGTPLDAIPPYTVVECDACGFKHVTPIPSDEELSKLYEEEFYTTAKPNYFANVEEDKEWWNMHFSMRLGILEHHAPGRKLLDIGSGPGYFLDCAKR